MENLFAQIVGPAMSSAISTLLYPFQIWTPNRVADLLNDAARDWKWGGRTGLYWIGTGFDMAYY